MSHGIFFVDSPGARLASYRDGGGGDPIVLLHGGPGVPDYLHDVAAGLADRHQVIRFDQRGTGRSTCTTGRYGLTDYVEDLESIRRACRIDRLNLFGHSWGGTLAQIYAARHPDHVERLCLCNSGIGLGSDWKAMEVEVMAHNRRRSGLAGFLRLGIDQATAILPGTAGDRGARRMMARVWRNYFDPPASAPPLSPEWLSGIHSRPIFRTRKTALRAAAGDLDGVGVDPTFKVLIMFGEDDIYGRTTERLVERFPSARVMTIPGCGHVPWVQNPGVFWREVRAFFDSE